MVKDLQVLKFLNQLNGIATAKGGYLLKFGFAETAGRRLERDSFTG
jgi:hypothetical protein